MNFQNYFFLFCLVVVCLFVCLNFGFGLFWFCNFDIRSKLYYLQRSEEQGQSATGVSVAAGDLFAWKSRSVRVGVCRAELAMGREPLTPSG